jgi:hypothetical protein
MVANLFDFHYINYRFRSTEDLNCAISSSYFLLFDDFLAIYYIDACRIHLLHSCT